MSEHERTERKKNCLSVEMKDGKPIRVDRCARFDKCRQAIEYLKPDKWECPGFVADEKAQAPDVSNAKGDGKDE